MNLDASDPNNRPEPRPARRRDHASDRLWDLVSFHAEKRHKRYDAGDYSDEGQYACLDNFWAALPPIELSSVAEVVKEATSTDHWLVTKVASVPAILWHQAQALGAVGIICVADPRAPLALIGPSTYGGRVRSNSYTDLAGIPFAGALLTSLTKVIELPTSSSSGAVVKSITDPLMRGDSLMGEDEPPPAENVEDAGAIATALDRSEMGWTNFCGQKSELRYGGGQMHWSNSRCWSLNHCSDCKHEDRRGWIQHLLTATEGQQLHSITVMDADYSAFVQRLRRRAFQYVAVQQSDGGWMIITSGSIFTRGGYSTTPVQNVYALLAEMFEHEPENSDRIKTSQGWSRRKIARPRVGEGGGEDEDTVQWRRSKDLSHGAFAKKMREIGVVIDRTAASGEAAMTEAQWEYAVENSWIVPRGPKGNSGFRFGPAMRQ